VKKILFFLFLLFCIQAPGLDYGDCANWVICEKNSADREQLFDLFYVYPTLVSDKSKPLMDWSQPKVAAKTSGFVRAQAGIWGKQARIFAPYVRQLEFTRCLPILKDPVSWERTLLKRGIDDTSDAFAYYMKHFNHGRPFVLLGHSQGAMELYYLLKNRKEISARSGFVAAYLIGLPKITAEQFSEDFRNRDIFAAKCANDLGVVIVWNTQNAEAKESLFSTPGGLCINPLNWHTDGVPAAADENRGAVFYNYKTGKTERKPAFCGAYVDPAKGALIVNLPSDGVYDAKGMIGKGVFHLNDIWFFAENLRRNAILRVNEWLRRNRREKR